MNSADTLPFREQRILIVGCAREGVVAARWLAERGARVVISDLQSPETLAPRLSELAGIPYELRTGPQTPELLQNIDALVVSPGVPHDIPLLQAARERHIPITGETRLFAQHCPAPITAITGSSGKTTTTTLTARMLEQTGHVTWLGGNIGQPLLASVTEIQPHHRVVMELSSFQLMYWGPQPAPPSSSTVQPSPFPWLDPRGLSPHIAAILNLTPNHLDRHPSMAHYMNAKAQILASQTEDDIAVLSHDDPITAAWARRRRVHIDAGAGQEAVEFPIKARVLTFGASARPAADGTWIQDDHIWLCRQGAVHRLMPLSDIRLRGAHNLLNVLAACCLATAAGAAPDALHRAVASFTGVEHRLEEVRHTEGVLWVNDSIATSPERSLAALHSFEEPIILLAGGRDKHLPWESWAQAVHQRVRHVITFGEAADLIERVLTPYPADSRLQGIHTGGDLAGAVALAARLARPGDVVLLSPGGTSYDAYQDFVERGRHFKALVADL
ncbi:MAG: UDP-N-acetylmuramoyl-L-alanine--D-glutamate ligase [Caldilineae bacterium]|nr:MAG: UDP-N-acetylmuramoyl-L-alanine--D-glutamate ligase [Caldilineae bacterium]